MLKVILELNWRNQNQTKLTLSMSILISFKTFLHIPPKKTSFQFCISNVIVCVIMKLNKSNLSPGVGREFLTRDASVMEAK